MPLARTIRPILVATLLAGCARPRAVEPASPVTPVSTATSASPRPPVATRVPNDIRWFRTSAEQRAAYLQAYSLAGERVAALAAGRSPGSWAVILDADETVLDNSVYQAERAALDSPYTDPSWDAWVARRAATALPGSVAFLALVHERGGRVAIVTNRRESGCEATRENLRAVGLLADRVLCRTTTGDKNPRFAAVAAGEGRGPVDVLLWVGDNVEDFPSTTQATLRTAPDSAYADFGRRFIVLPNPMYGSWQ